MSKQRKASHAESGCPVTRKRDAFSDVTSDKFVISFVPFTLSFLVSFAILFYLQYYALS